MELGRGKVGERRCEVIVMSGSGRVGSGIFQAGIERGLVASAALNI